VLRRPWPTTFGPQIAGEGSGRLHWQSNMKLLALLIALVSAIASFCLGYVCFSTRWLRFLHPKLENDRAETQLCLVLASTDPMADDCPSPLLAVLPPRLPRGGEAEFDPKRKSRSLFDHPLTVASGCGGLASCFRAVQVSLATVTRRKALRQRRVMKHLGRLLFLDRA
jgi:hypothetical protein